MGPDQQRLSPDERFNLVAYLDGELEEHASRAIATKLTQSVTARREVDALRKTWELLDLLPRPRASEDFTARTVTVATRAADRSPAASEMARRVAGGLAWAAASALLFVAGYLTTARAWPDPTARLARDLSIAESLDEYRDVGSFEFLDQIDNAPEFN